MTRIGDRAVAVMPIVDKISFASRAQVPIDLQKLLLNRSFLVHQVA